MKEVERHKLNPASASSSRETQREKGKVFRVCKFCGSFFWKHSVVFNKFFLPSFVKLFFEDVCEFQTVLMNIIEESFQNNFKVWEPLKAWQSYKLMGASRVRQKHQQTLDVNRNWWRPTSFGEVGVGLWSVGESSKRERQLGVTENQSQIGRESYDDCGEIKRTCGEGLLISLKKLTEFEAEV